MGNENGTEHKLFFRAFNAAKAKREAERQAREQEEQERAEAFALAIEAKENAEKALELAEAKWQKYEVRYEACRGALEKICEQCALPKTEDKKADELDCRTRLEIVRSIASVILEMQKQTEGG